MATPQQQALALIQSYYSTFNSGDREAFLALLTDDVVHDINQGGAENGREAFRTFLARMDRCYREQVRDLVVFAAEDGTRGAAEFDIEGEYLATDEGLPPATGQRYRLRVGAFFDIQDGKVRRVTNYYNLEEWLRQVGAAPQGA
ncbi:MAG: nuclear transport factor 2 family protein [Verrucomicrobia bacterium]|nr:nuclear transport factor 2 family protein [Verrucomicrobiota bacterium]